MSQQHQKQIDSKNAKKLNTGAYMPILGFGTFKCEPKEIGKALRVAIETGYRSIDCAAAYDNEKEIGETFTQIFKEGLVKREQLFITTKLRQFNMDPKEIQDQLNQQLKDLQLEYLDLYLIHLPIPVKKDGDKCVPNHGGFGIQDIWRKMEELHGSGKVKAIGVSNCPSIMLNDILGYCKVKPAVNQIERHPYLQQPKHKKFAQEHGVEITAYAPLGSPGEVSDTKPDAPSLLENETIVKIAKAHNKSPAQVLIRWAVQSDAMVLAKSTTEERIKENFGVWDFELTSNDMDEIKKLDKGMRYFDQDWMGVPCFV